MSSSRNQFSQFYKIGEIMVFTAIKDKMVNSIPKPEPISAVRFIDATKGCLKSLESIGLRDYRGFLADPKNLDKVKAELEQCLTGDSTEETLVLIDGWFDDDVCGNKDSTFSEPAIEVFNFVSQLGFHAVIYRGYSDESEACSLAAREVVTSYLT